MMNSMTGGMDTATGFNQNFNMLLPLLLADDDDDTTTTTSATTTTTAASTTTTTAATTTTTASTTTATPVEDNDDDLLVLLLAMQTMNPESTMNANSMLPLMFMKSDSANSELIMFMSMMNNQHC